MLRTHKLIDSQLLNNIKFTMTDRHISPVPLMAQIGETLPNICSVKDENLLATNIFGLRPRRSTKYLVSAPTHHMLTIKTTILRNSRNSRFSTQTEN